MVETRKIVIIIKRQNYYPPYQHIEQLGTGKNADHQLPNTYVAGETYTNSHVLSKIFPPLQPVREEIEKDETTDDNISLTRDMLRSIISNALEQQKRVVDATTAEAIKVDFSEGIKRVSDFLVNPLYSCTTGKEMEHHVDQSPIGLHQPTELQAVHLLSPSRAGNTGRPSLVISIEITCHRHQQWLRH